MANTIEFLLRVLGFIIAGKIVTSSIGSKFNQLMDGAEMGALIIGPFLLILMLAAIAVLGLIVGYFLLLTVGKKIVPRENINSGSRAITALFLSYLILVLAGTFK
ncbi:MAG: hypothetical protein R3A80_07545 [Bdellovibrionota bacterium]